MSNNFDFINYLQENAYSNVIVPTDYVVDLQGWKSSNFDTNFSNILIETYNFFQEPLMIYEIGSWKGLTATTMATIAKVNNIPCKIICIDTWLGSPDYLTLGINDNNQGLSLNLKNGYPQIYYTFLNNIITLGHNDIIIPFPMSSIEAADILKFYNINSHITFIDGSREYISIHTNLSKYWKLLKNDGYIYGDYYNQENYGIKNAVDDFSTAVMSPIIIDDFIWNIKKPHNYL